MEKTLTIQEKLTKYEEILTEFANSEGRSIGIIKSEPIERNGTFLFRVGDNIYTFGGIDLFTNENVDPYSIKVGTEVIVKQGVIIAISPNSLKIKNNHTTEFKKIAWSEIGGLKSQLTTIRTAIETSLGNKEIVEEMGLEPISGILLYGPPGTGKTMIAKAIASTVFKEEVIDGDAFVYLKGSDILSKYVGDSEQHISSIFRNCRKFSKENGQRSVIFIDEAEALLSSRGGINSSSAHTGIVATFLAEMDGFDDKQFSPLVILATNLPDALDKAIIREGRIDLKIEINNPSKEDFYEILQIHLSKVKTFDNIENLAQIGSEAVFTCSPQRASGAFSHTLVKLAAQKAIQRKLQDSSIVLGIISQDIEDSINELK